jgi:uncharacterized tellurite resistance protein B-like protein
MQPKEAHAITLGKMVLCDGSMSNAERRLFLSKCKQAEVAPADVLNRAAHTTLAELAQALTAYPDRFVVALGTLQIAQADGMFRTEERDFYERVLQVFGIEPNDRELLTDQIEAIEATWTGVPPRLLELLDASSLDD